MTPLVSHNPIPPGDRIRFTKRNDAVLLVTFLVWPALAAAVAFLTLHRRVSQAVLFLFMTLLGFRYVIDDPRLDSYRLAGYAEQMAQRSLPQFKQWVADHCFHTEACIDPVMPLYTFLLTRLDDHHSVAFTGYAAVFAVFSIAYLYNIRKSFPSHTTLFCWFMLLAILALNGIQNIGGFRFNAAIWVFVLGAYYIFYRGSLQGFVLIFSSIAFHFAMSVPVVIALSLWFFRPRLRAAIIFLILSFVLSAPVTLLTQFTGLDTQLGAAARAERYLAETTLAARAELIAQAHGNLLFTVYGHAGLKIFIVFWAAMFLLRRKNFQVTGSKKQFLLFSTMFLAISSFISEIPSFDRFVTIGIILLLTAILITANAYTVQERRWMVGILLPGLLLATLVPLRIALSTLDMLAFFPTPFLLLDPITFLTHK